MINSLKLSPFAFERAMRRMMSAEIRRSIKQAPGESVDRSIDHLTWSRRYLPHYFRKPPSELHKWLAEEIHAARKQRGRKINVLGPRGGAKSTVGNTSYVLRCGVEGTERYILILGRTEGLAAKQLSHVKRELEENSELARDYPESCGRGSVWSDTEIRLRNGVQIQAFGAGQSIRGARNAADRPTLVIGDDIQEDDAITSKVTRDRDWTWFTGSVLKIGTRETNFINLGNALHREAIGSRLEQTPGWDTRVFSSIIEWPSNMGLWEEWSTILHNHDDPQAERSAEAFYAANLEEMTDGARVLWPEWESLYDLMFMRETEGRNAFERDKQARVATVDSNEWPDSYFDDHIWFDDWPTSWIVKTMALDPSKGRDVKKGDYQAYVMLMISRDGTLYVDADMKRRPVPEMITDGVSIHREFQPDAFCVEANAWQELLAGEFGDEFRRQGLFNADPWTIDNRVNKYVRIRRLGPYLAQKRIKFRANSPGCKILVNQLRDFPDKNAHDDGPDALEMAIRLAQEFTSADRHAADPVADTLAQRGFV